MRTLLLAVIAVCSLTLVGCAGSEVDEPNNANSENVSTNSLPEGCNDEDGDGFGGRGATCPDGPDCDDNDRSVNPTASEACGDQQDNNCDGTIDEGCERDCIDGDGDGYGDGPACLGPDCDDNDRNIRPRADDICDNDIDEDCDGMDRVCPANCIDMDNDGFGAAGSTDCETAEIDCDDNNAAINPMATEICNEVDDNCNDTTDECGGTGQACVNGACLGGPGSECINNDQCAGSSVCDTNSDPKVCKQTEGGNCQMSSDCVTGLACENGMCSGNFCASDPCNDAAVPFCYREVGQCVECPIYDPDISVQDAACSGGEQCTPGGWCALNDIIPNSDPVGNTTQDILVVSLLMVDCWNQNRNGVKNMCFSLFVSSSVSGTITESDVEDAYLDGDLATVISSDQDDVLNDLWGPGFFNAKEVEWKSDIVPGTAKETCLWYEPGNAFGIEAVVIDRCENYSP